MSKLCNENYFCVQSFMVTELGLKGNDLVIFAVIYGFSQAEDQAYTGGLPYLMEWTNSTKQGVLRSIKSLLDKGFIIKTERIINGVKFVDYRSTKFNGVVNKVERGGKQSLPNNKSDNKEINKSYKEESTKEESETQKRFRAPSEDEVRQYIEEKGYKVNAKKFVSYYEANGWKVGKNPMKNWKAAVSNWEARDRDAVVKPQAPKDVRPKASSFDTKDFFEASLKRAYKEG